MRILNYVQLMTNYLQGSEMYELIGILSNVSIFRFIAFDGFILVDKKVHFGVRDIREPVSYGYFYFPRYAANFSLSLHRPSYKNFDLLERIPLT